MQRDLPSCRANAQPNMDIKPELALLLKLLVFGAGVLGPTNASPGAAMQNLRLTSCRTPGRRESAFAIALCCSAPLTRSPPPHAAPVPAAAPAPVPGVRAVARAADGAVTAVAGPAGARLAAARVATARAARDAGARVGARGLGAVPVGRGGAEPAHAHPRAALCADRAAPRAHGVVRVHEPPARVGRHDRESESESAADARRTAHDAR